MRNERVIAAHGKGVKLKYVQDDRQVNQNDQPCAHEESASDAASKLVQLGNKLDRGHASVRTCKPADIIRSVAAAGRCVVLTMTGFPGKET